MRFRKRVKIVKGLYINFSNSGVSMSAGVRGLSFTTGKNGTYVNYGIPGTGIYDRKRILNAQDNLPKTFSLKLNDDGKVDIYDENGDIIYDITLIRKLKKTDEYSYKLEYLVSQKKSNYDTEMSKWINLHKNLSSIETVDYYKNILKNLVPQKYEKEKFSIKEPNKEDIINELDKEAREKISKFLFWKRKKLINEYISNNKEERLKIRLENWINLKNEFEISENKKEKNLNEKYLKDYEFAKEELEKNLSNNKDYIENIIDDSMKNLNVPFDFSVDFELKDEYIYIDLDLPEIEDMPEEKIQEMKSGVVKLKNKTKKEIKQDYYDCVLGLGILVAHKIFMNCFGIVGIIISGYTQREKKLETIDEYIYSIKFERNKFKNHNFNLIGPKYMLAFFDNIIDIKSDMSLKKIEPFKNNWKIKDSLVEEYC